jgi:oligoribonuclease
MAEQIIKNLVWIDLEMTGLNIAKDKIIEIGVLVTDTDLNILDEKGFVRYIHIDQKDVDGMIDVVKNMHTSNGLIQKCLESDVSIEQADADTVEYLKQFVGEKESPLCGNSISVDRNFIEFNMSSLNRFLHWRNIDVTTLKQLLKLWKGEEYFKPNGEHEALGDIKESIEELKFYKEKLF